MRVHFNWVGVKAIKRWKDADGNPKQETRHFRQTVNPFNLAAGGLPKTSDQIMQEEIAKRDAWLKQGPPND